MRWWHVLLVLIGLGMILQAALPAGAAIPVGVAAPQSEHDPVARRAICIPMAAVLADAQRRARARGQLLIPSVAASGVIRRLTIEVWDEQGLVVFTFVGGCLAASKMMVR